MTAKPSWVYLSVGFMRAIVPHRPAVPGLGAPARYRSAHVRQRFPRDQRGIPPHATAEAPSVRYRPSGPTPEPADPEAALSWSAPSHQRRWLRMLGRALARVDVWILIVAIAGVVIAYLAWVKPH